MTLRKQTRQLLKYEASTDDILKKRSAALAICDWYVVLHSDSRYATSEMLRGDAATVRKRLIRISIQTEAKLKRTNVPEPRDLQRRVDQMIADFATESPGDSESEPTTLAAAGGGAAVDEGWQLVELIQRIIAPDFWQPQGGPGVVRYFALKRALVVRATSDVQQQVQELLMALR